MFPFSFITSVPLLSNRCPPRAKIATCPRMSGVNGGIDYEIDLTTLPAALATRIQTMQQGPDSPTQLIEAATEIAQSASTHPQTLPVLVDMLGFNNPIAANIAIVALAKAGTPAIPALLTGVSAFNYAVNAYALRALALIGDPSVADVCLACANRGPIPNVRRAACRALAGLKYCTKTQADEAYDCLLHLARREADWGVRYAAIVAIENFVSESIVNDSLQQQATALLKEITTHNNNTSDDASDDASDDVLFPVDATVLARAHVARQVLSSRHTNPITT